jgi:hypothetical protein
MTMVDRRRELDEGASNSQLGEPLNLERSETWWPLAQESSALKVVLITKVAVFWVVVACRLV